MDYQDFLTMNWTALVFTLIAATSVPLSNAEYTETITITNLPNQNILSDISFKLTSPQNLLSSADNTHANLGTFPSLIYALPNEFGLMEGKLTFTRGLWNSERWAKAPNSPTSSGFQFHGHFKNSHKNTNIETRFNKAIEVFSGYFCASLNILQFANAIKPTIPTFTSRSIVPDSTMIAGIIPQEPVCIENLRPWLDLLPCSNRAGLTQMIKPESIYQSDFHSIELEFFVNESMQIDLTLRMITVYDLNRWNANRNWSLTSLLGKSFVKSCPLSKTSPKVILRLPKSNQSELISSLIHPKTEISAHDDHLVIEYEGKDLLEEIGATEVPNQSDPIDKAHPFRAYRYKSGSTDDFGGLGLVLVNDQDSALEITVIESIPWLFRLFLHQAEFTLNYQPINDVSKYLKQFSIVPAIVRKRNMLIQSKLLLPPQSRIQILVPFEREFLRIDEFPQNSERGIEMPGALIFYKQSDNVVVTETTNTLLYTWPIPDATMPFNVITMTSTLAALFYGSFFNLIFRRFYLKHASDPPPGAIPKLIWNIKKKFIK